MTNQKTERTGPLARIPEVADYLAVSKSKVYSMLEQGLLRGVHIGGNHRVLWESVDQLVEGGEKGAKS